MKNIKISNGLLSSVFGCECEFDDSMRATYTLFGKDNSILKESSVGKEFYIASYHFDNKNGKCSRHVKPTKVRFDVKEKYQLTHRYERTELPIESVKLVKIGKKGEDMKGDVDLIGLSFFDTMEDCENFYNYRYQLSKKLLALYMEETIYLTNRRLEKIKKEIESFE